MRRHKLAMPWGLLLRASVVAMVIAVGSTIWLGNQRIRDLGEQRDARDSTVVALADRASAISQWQRHIFDYQVEDPSARGLSWPKDSAQADRFYAWLLDNTEFRPAQQEVSPAFEFHPDTEDGACLQATLGSSTIHQIVGLESIHSGPCSPSQEG